MPCWLWTEWATVLSAAIIAGCWIYDEFVARPALDQTVRVALLGTASGAGHNSVDHDLGFYHPVGSADGRSEIEMTASSTHAV